MRFGRGKKSYDGGGKTRFLPAQFIQFEPGAGNTVAPIEAIAFHLIVMGLMTADGLGAGFARMDGSGAVLLLALSITQALYVQHIIDTGGTPKEPNRSALEQLNPLTNAICRFSPYPAHINDQVPVPDTGDFPFDAIFTVMRHFGIYHQKLSVVKNTRGMIAYCGGVDLSPNRLDDARHLNSYPFHDVHCRIDGAAVRDMALTFDQRWRRDGGGEDPAFDVPDGVDEIGSHIVQVARTYSQAADSSRAFDFAPQGDRTIANSMIKGIHAAREFIYIEDQYFTPPQIYRDALIDKVSSGDIKKLIVAIPGANDQPFGDLARLPPPDAVLTASGHLSLM